MGVFSFTPTDPDDHKNLVAAADMGIYRAKNTGPDRVSNTGRLMAHEGTSAGSLGNWTSFNLLRSDSKCLVRATR